MREKLLLTGISKQFSTDRDLRVTAFKDIDLTIMDGEFVCILGPTGCGKTTLLRIMAGLETPTEGSLRIDTVPVASVSEACTLVFQQYSLFPWLSVSQNVAFPLELKGYTKHERRKKARELLDHVGLGDFEDARPYELSGGMQQRAAIARALAYDPDILLMDEPFGALDEKTRRQLQILLLDIWRERLKTVVFVTHNIDEAIILADRIVVMASGPGRIVEHIDVPLNRPRDRVDKSFSSLYTRLRALLEL